MIQAGRKNVHHVSVFNFECVYCGFGFIATAMTFGIISREVFERMGINRRDRIPRRRFRDILMEL